MKPRTLLDKLWDAHVVVPEDEAKPAVLYVDLHLIHEVTSPQAFKVLADRGLSVRRPERSLATMDHSTPTLPLDQWDDMDPAAAAQIQTLSENCHRHGIEIHGLDSAQRGIVHVIGPELGATQPGRTIVCGDSHTSTHGAFGALAFGIGTTEVGHVLATQCLLQRKPKSMAVVVDGNLHDGVSAKDVVLAIIGELGVGGATAHVIEYRGSAIESLSMEERMTVCNMSIEAGARAGLIAPDETTFRYLEGRRLAPSAADWDAAVARWRDLPSDPDAAYDREVRLDGDRIEPMVTWGTNPGMVIPVNGCVPDLATSNEHERKALDYMGLSPGQSILGQPVDVVFVGSCTNGRLFDLREAAVVLRGRRVDPRVRMLVVPGSYPVKAQAEAEGLDEVFRNAGAEWREPGCSMCIAMNGDAVARGQYAVSTSNRNFVGRQGVGSRTLLASPATAAAAAVRGQVTDPRELMDGATS